LMMACGGKQSGEETSGQVTETYDEFILDNQQVMLNDSVYSNEGYAKNNFDKFQNLTGVLSESDITTILDHELTMLRSKPDISPAESGPAIAIDTIVSKRSCASFDNAPSTTVKAFQQKKLLFPMVFPRQYSLRLAIHVIEDPAIGSVVTDAEIREQINILNKAFATINISFEIETLNRKPQAAWYKANPVRSPSAYQEMTGALSADPGRYINIFINGMDDWGYGTFPWLSVYKTKQDCVLIKDKTLQGKTIDDGCTQATMLGKTLIHEMGHFMGLLHTFHSDQKQANGSALPCNTATYDGCANGDLVSDTPSQKICHFYGCGECVNGSGCCSNCGNVQVCDTCPAETGNDPVKNFMGYNPDTCMDHFTVLQYSRMEQWFFDSRMYAVKTVVNLY
jgi:hypothetical protein